MASNVSILNGISDLEIYDTYDKPVIYRQILLCIFELEG